MKQIEINMLLIRNQQVGGSNPPAGSSHAKVMAASPALSIPGRPSDPLPRRMRRVSSPLHFCDGHPGPKTLDTFPAFILQRGKSGDSSIRKHGGIPGDKLWVSSSQRHICEAQGPES
ncbi:MAG: hypothetical protein QXT73_06520, partial [Candidatus Methanomethylicaceae archaeon]